MSDYAHYTISPINTNKTILQILKRIELYLQENPIPSNVVTEEYVQTMINTLCVKKTDILSEVTGTSDNPVSSRAINGKFNDVILQIVGIVQQLNGKANASEVISSLGGKTGVIILGNGLSIDNDNVLSASGGSGDNWTLHWSGSWNVSTTPLNIGVIDRTLYSKIRIEYVAKSSASTAGDILTKVSEDYSLLSYIEFTLAKAVNVGTNQKFGVCCLSLSPAYGYLQANGFIEASMQNSGGFESNLAHANYFRVTAIYIQ